MLLKLQIVSSLSLFPAFSQLFTSLLHRVKAVEAQADCQQGGVNFGFDCGPVFNEILPPVEVNIRALGSMAGKDIPPVDVWMSYRLIPIKDLCMGDRIADITTGLLDTDLQSLWQLAPFPTPFGTVEYSICLPRLLGCIQFYPLPVRRHRPQRHH
jgi:hypothetical protein